jgi:hypothetical protein
MLIKSLKTACVVKNMFTPKCKLSAGTNSTNGNGIKRLKHVLVMRPHVKLVVIEILITPLPDPASFFA